MPASPAPCWSSPPAPVYPPVRAHSASALPHHREVSPLRARSAAPLHTAPDFALPPSAAAVWSKQLWYAVAPHFGIPPGGLACIPPNRLLTAVTDTLMSSFDADEDGLLCPKEFHSCMMRILPPAAAADFSRQKSDAMFEAGAKCAGYDHRGVPRGAMRLLLATASDGELLRILQLLRLEGAGSPAAEEEQPNPLAARGPPASSEQKGGASGGRSTPPDPSALTSAEQEAAALRDRVLRLEAELAEGGTLSSSEAERLVQRRTRELEEEAAERVRQLEEETAERVRQLRVRQLEEETAERVRQLRVRQLAEDAAQRIRDLESEMCARSAEATSREEQLEALAAGEQRAAAEAAARAAALEREVREHAAAAAGAAELAAEAARLRERAEAAEREGGELRRQLAAAEGDFMGGAELLARRVTAAQGELESAKQQLAAAQERASQLAEANEALSSEAAGLREALSDRSLELSQIRSDADAARRAQTGSESARLKSESALRTECDRLRGAIQDGDAECERLRTLVQQEEADRAAEQLRWAEQRAAAERAQGRLETRIEDLEQQLERERCMREEAAAELQALRASNAALRDQCTAAAAEGTAAMHEARRLAAKTASDDDEMRRLHEEPARLRAELLDLRTRHEELLDKVRNWDVHRFDVIAREIKKTERAFSQLRQLLGGMTGPLKKVTDSGLRQETLQAVSDSLALVASERQHMSVILAQCLSVTEKLTIGAASGAPRSAATEALNMSVASAGAVPMLHLETGSSGADQSEFSRRQASLTRQRSPRMARRRSSVTALPVRATDFSVGMAVIDDKRGRGEVVDANLTQVTVRFGGGDKRVYKEKTLGEGRLRQATAAATPAGPQWSAGSAGRRRPGSVVSQSGASTSPGGSPGPLRQVSPRSPRTPLYRAGNYSFGAAFSGASNTSELARSPGEPPSASRSPEPAGGDARPPEAPPKSLQISLVDALHLAVPAYPAAAKGSASPDSAAATMTVAGPLQLGSYAAPAPEEPPARAQPAEGPAGAEFSLSGMHSVSPATTGWDQSGLAQWSLRSADPSPQGS
eukprot:TRINITY_DN13344_c0_g1_i2.p1 TRINITY_DN13344_c0_g1~~TRINITY_DN13344_c0_g1_i2.p1  ORF type:complete len:1079 (+),score=384.21 TRINITY_DN13344_c0_g1_i2:74-3238(+)